MKSKFIILTSLVLSVFFSAQQTVTGYVFEDSNKNSIKDRREKGIANVAVSNGVDVILTDQNGKYLLPVSDDATVFVIKPENYATPVNENKLPKFYYHHKPHGSPTHFQYKGTAPTGKLPAEVNFPLYHNTENKDFRIIVFGDPQPYNLKEIDYFRRGIINEVKNNRKNAVFGISLGDLVGDNLDLHQPYIHAVKELGLPWYNVMGNHDMNYEAKEDRHSDETFEANFGPANYAFNYGNVHFMILDNILYPDPRDHKGYWGGFREDQLRFIENNLKHVDKNKLVVVSFHIQLMAERAGDDHFRLEDRNQLFELLKPFKNVLMMSAHTHKQRQIFYGKQEGWNGDGELHELNMGTTSGDWYSGTVDEMGVPLSVMRDGTYRGYSYVSVKNNQYEVQYKVAGKPEDFMIQLHVPKVIPQSRTSVRLYANFFTGSEKDIVEFRINGGDWKKMNFVNTFDPAYMLSVFEWDAMEKFPAGRRPSNPELSSHVWNAAFPGDLAVGRHTVEVRATDRYGKTFTASESFEVQLPTSIP